MATKDGRVQIWYADDNGNVEGYTESVGDIVETIITAYNEHFGTDIGLWTPETKTLQVGDTVPNWNAYEKIEMPLNLDAIIMYTSTQGFAVNVAEGVGNIICYNENSPAIFDANKIFRSSGPPFSYAEEKCKNVIQSRYGVTIDNWLPKVEQLTVNQEIPESEKYIVINT